MGAPVMMDPLKERDIRIPVSMSPAMPSHMLPLCSLPPSHSKFALGGGKLGTTAPLDVTLHTASGLVITYVNTCRAEVNTPSKRAAASDG